MTQAAILDSNHPSPPSPQNNPFKNPFKGLFSSFRGDLTGGLHKITPDTTIQE